MSTHRTHHSLRREVATDTAFALAFTAAHAAVALPALAAWAAWCDRRKRHAG